MKRTSLAAAALLLSTTAYAAIPSTEPTGVTVEKDPYTVTSTYAVDNAYAGGTGTLHNAAYESWTADNLAAEPVAYTADDPLAADDAAFKQTADDEADMVDNVDKADAIEMAQAEVDTADVADEGEDVESMVEPTAMDTAATPIGDSGVGGPYEGVDTATNLTPRPAAQNYPACSPGPGDDRCIQLYEPGVRAQLASWGRSTGGFAGEAGTQVAMGGPYEPVDSAAETERLNQQALADSASAVQTASAYAQPVDDSAIETASADEGNLATDGEQVDDEDMVEV